ncbi:MAG: hypothetical protein GEU87_09345 [Alphaproteobacteria bacterium]|nr:hypothetical protein [Alphaproteobacteria bacterium]
MCAGICAHPLHVVAEILCREMCIDHRLFDAFVPENFGKSVLLTDLAGALENGTLGILRALPMRDLLLEELASFETKTTPADMATTLALAWFVSEHMPGRFEEGRLIGWY